MERIFLFLLGCFFLFACGNGLDPDYNINYKLIDNEKLSCPPPAIFHAIKYGKSGVFFVCKFNDGPFVAVENGYVNIRGKYKAGWAVGLWEYYDKDGNVVNSIYYPEAD